MREMKTSAWILLLIGLASVVGGVYFFLHREERQIEGKIRDAMEAFENQNWAALEACLDPEFSYSSSNSYVGSGNLESVQSRLGQFWRRSSKILIVRITSEVRVAGMEAEVDVRGNLKFDMSEIGRLAIYVYRAQVFLSRVGSDWMIREIKIPELKPGLF